MEQFLQNIAKRARENPQRIVFPEGEEERILMACEMVLKAKTAHPILLGTRDTILTKARNLRLRDLELQIKSEKIEIIDPQTDQRKTRYAEELFALRKEKGMTESEAEKIITNINYFGTMMVQLDDADGMVAGTTFSTANSIRPALQIIKTKERFRKVSGFFFMVLEDRLLLFADCAILPEPNSHELSDIAIDTAETAKRFGIEPRIAMLSFSTNGSAKHPSVDVVKEATEMVRHERPDLNIDGEMQVDAALVPKISKRKFPNSKVPGNANILIFPNLAAANIAYKLVERLAHAKAVGPVLQGLKKPVNDLSRGCSAEDIAHLAAITTIEAQELDYADLHEHKKQ